MNKIIAVFALALFAVAPIKAQPQSSACRADQAAIWARVNQNVPHPANEVSVETLWDWEEEMANCAHSDPRNTSNYLATFAQTAMLASTREEAFISRQHLLHQF